ncbi:ComEC/Rec2 family competence protein [Ekhidna sp.]|uniref:ComEC/Rec2 family competence protein n=1 Tax=Ekhidna sp. TaxID=2608089 RepID=UPI003CCB7CB9
MIDISIDMLSLGNADSIIVWLKDDDENHCVILIDGGNKSDGQKVIDHLEKYIQPHVGYAAPDILISTHHDKDHIGGLVPIVEYFGNGITKVWVNNPADHISDASYQSLKNSFRIRSERQQFKIILDSLNNLEEFIFLVDSKGIQRENALYGQEAHNGVIKVLGPSKEFYDSLLPGMEGVENYVLNEARFAYKYLFNNPEIDDYNESNLPCPIVDEENTTSATNNSSVVLMIQARGKKYLFTGDAGVSAFEDIENRESLEDIFWLDVPHHGSRRNLSSRLIDVMSPDTAYISAVGNRKHPGRALINCLKRHGSKVFSTHRSNNMVFYSGDFPSRSDYGPIEEV